MKNQKISIIIPVFNSEKYLEECLNSIISQKYSNLEIIIIDDGSSDSSFLICKKFENIDKRIKVLRQKNQGPGVARNVGLLYATGEWLSFIDSDDILESDFYSKLLSYGDKYDVICSGVKIFFDVKNDNSSAETDFYNKLSNLNGEIEINFKLMSEINTELWNKLFKRDIFKAYNINFRNGAFEDGHILFSVLALSKNIFIDNSVNYLYRRHKQSLVEDLSNGIIRDNYNVITGSIEEVKDLYYFYEKNNILEKNWKFLIFLLERNYNFVSSQILESQRKNYDVKMSDFLERYVSNEIIDKHANDKELFYRLKTINVFTPFHVPLMWSMQSVKIAVCYHKPSLLPQKNNDIFFPIHVGRALLNTTTKDGDFSSKENVDWLFDNMIGDDTGDNISKKNREYCELTATYWVWKNYDKIGNPEYFGLCHYRRIFNLYDQKFDADVFIAPTWNCQFTAQEQYENAHHSNEMKLALEVISSDYPDYKSDALEYYNDHKMHLLNIFIMKRNIFFNYAKWLFDILSKVKKRMSYDYRSYQDLRGIAYLAERLQDLYVLKLRKDNYIIRELPLLCPEDKQLRVKSAINSVSKDSKIIVTASDNNYILYTGVMINSLISNIKKDEKYEIYILYESICQENKNKIKKLENKNVCVNFVDVTPYLSNYNNFFKTNAHFTIATYFRFFIPEIFLNFDKVLYLDPDVVILSEVSSLYDIKLDDSVLLAACRDVEAERKCYEFSELQEYFYHKLNIKNIHDYFQAGVMLLNLKSMRLQKITDLCLAKLRKVNKPMWVDQDILNSVVGNNVCYLDPKWNFPVFLMINDNELLNKMDYRVHDIMKKTLKNPSIIHFCGGKKPWNDPSLPFSIEFWKYARKTPFYEEILNNLINHRINDITLLNKNNDVYDLNEVHKKNKLHGLEYIMSLKNENGHKVLRIAGLKIASRKI